MSVIDTVMHDPVYLYEAFTAVTIYPVVRIFRRAGLKPACAAFLPIPVVGLLICAGILALCKWRTA
jgi:hypothetical protein